MLIHSIINQGLWRWRFTDSLPSPSLPLVFSCPWNIFLNPPMFPPCQTGLCGIMWADVWSVFGWQIDSSSSFHIYHSPTVSHAWVRTTTTTGLIHTLHLNPDKEAIIHSFPFLLHSISFTVHSRCSSFISRSLSWSHLTWQQCFDFVYTSWWFHVMEKTGSLAGEILSKNKYCGSTVVQRWYCYTVL